MGRPYNTNYNLKYKCECKHLLAFADRIDMEQEHRMEERADQYSELRAKMNNYYIELPKDADKVPWKPGDRDEDGNVVTHLMLTSDGWFVTDGEWSYRPESKRHYHAPTVEDVLCDLLNEYRENECTLEEARLSEYASKLRLAEKRENA